MRPPTEKEIADPNQARRYLEEMARVVGGLVADKNAPVPTPGGGEVPNSTTQTVQLPDAQLANLKLEQIARVHNYDGGVIPTGDNNASQGYSPGSLWIIQGFPPIIYMCASASNSGAQWVKISP